MADPIVYVVDDDMALCKSMEWLISSVGLNVKAFHSAKDFLKFITPDKHGCLLLDVRMPQVSGLEIQQELNRLNIKLPIVFITSHHDVDVAVKAMKRGALDFITKPFSEQQLLDLVHKAIQTDVEFVEKKSGFDALAERFSALTKREKQVLKYVVSGMLNKNISTELNISSKTVELHRSNVMKKVQANSLAELVKMNILYQSGLDERKVLA